MARSLPGWVKASLAAVALAAAGGLVGYGLLKGEVLAHGTALTEAKTRLDKAEDRRYHDQEALTEVKVELGKVQASVDLLSSAIEGQKAAQTQQIKDLKTDLSREIWRAMRRSNGRDSHP